MEDASVSLDREDNYLSENSSTLEVNQKKQASGVEQRKSVCREISKSSASEYP